MRYDLYRLGVIVTDNGYEVQTACTRLGCSWRDVVVDMDDAIYWTQLHESQCLGEDPPAA